MRHFANITMKKLVKKLGLKRILFYALNILLVIAALICFASIQHLGKLLDTQHEAERWQGESEVSFSQLSAFIPVDESFDLSAVAAMRTDVTNKIHEAALDIENEEILFVDAWSARDKLSVSSTIGKGEVSVTAVGGEFFSFHPLTLLSGNYISSGDLMQDRVLLDEETAWLLFGGTDIQGMSFKINGQPFVVAGVIEREQDFATKKAYTDGMGIFMSYDAYRMINENASIECYELVMPNPVKGFALNFMTEKFPVKTAEIVSNTDRFSLTSLWKLLRGFDERSMQTRGVLYPYWENAARCVEDRAAMLLAAVIAALVLPVLTLLVLIVKYAVIGKNKLEDDVLPELKDKTEEAIRVRQRANWEKRERKRKGSHEA